MPKPFLMKSYSEISVSMRATQFITLNSELLMFIGKELQTNPRGVEAVDEDLSGQPSDLLQMNLWDTVAGVHLIRQVGATVADLEGNRWHHDSTGLIASNGEIHGELLKATRQIES